MLDDQSRGKMPKRRSKKRKKRRGFPKHQRHWVTKRPTAYRQVLKKLKEPPLYFGIEDAKNIKQTVVMDAINDTSNIHERHIEALIDESRRLKVCNNRRKRRKILFSIRKAGKGKAGPRRKKYTEQSKVRC